MTISAHSEGNPIYFHKEKEQWLYTIDDTPVDGPTHKPCISCGEMPTKDGHDPCIKNLPGVRNACCGHGNSPMKPSVQFYDGSVVDGWDAVELFDILKRASPPRFKVKATLKE